MTAGLQMLKVLLDMVPSFNRKFLITLTTCTLSGKQGSVLQTDETSCGKETM
jgi:hypothetical protein